MTDTQFLPENEVPALPANHQTIVLEKRKPAKMTAKRKSKIKRFITKTCVTILIIISVTTYGAYKINQFFASHELQFRSPLQMPVLIVPRRHSENTADEVISQAHAKEINFEGADFISKQEIPNANEHSGSIPTNIDPDINKIVSKVYRLESSGGKNDPCRASGQYNGYGFAPGTCYKTHAIVTAKVAQWFQKTLGNHDLPFALCAYNLGPNSGHIVDCINQSAAYPYYRDYLSLLTN